MTDYATDSNTVAKTYTWGLDLSGDLQGAGGVGGLLCVTQHQESSTQNPYYVSYDANGNVSEYINDSDSLVAHYEYSPFGKITSSSGSKADDFNHRFSTKYLDVETALYYYGYRYYSNELGRWVSRDQIEELGGWNQYCFVINAPLDMYDYLGMLPAGRRAQRKDAENRLIKAKKRLHNDSLGHVKRSQLKMRVESAKQDLKESYTADKGHSDLPGGDEFDFVKEDEGWSGPWNPFSTGNHFQELVESERQVGDAIDNCNFDKYERTMHRGQDYQTHRGKGYQFKPFGTLKDLGFGHVPSTALHTISGGRFGENPDSDRGAWNDAADWTRDMNARWHENCCKCGDSWNVKSEGPCDDDN